MKRILLFALLMGLVHIAYAVKVESLYAGEVPVSSQDEHQRDQAIRLAFAQALTKVSGSPAVLQNPVIRAAEEQAKNKVQEFGYLPSGVAATPFLLKVQFDPRAIKDLLHQAKAPIWDQDRPLILVILSVEDGSHPAELIDSSSTNEFALFLKKSAEQRGVPLLLPMMDVSDLNQIAIVDVHSFSVAALQKAADRYHTDGLLIGSIEQKGKTIQSHWKLVIGKDQTSWDIEGPLAPVIMETLTNKMTSLLGGRYAAVLTDNSPSSFNLVVKGVSEHDDFENLMHFVKHMSLIKELEIENITGDEVVLHLAVQGTQKAFIQDASVGQHLQLLSETANELTYTWVR